MNKIEVRLTQVYRINGRLVVANSIEGAINTWREWYQPNCPDIRSIERMGNDSYQTVGDDALVIAEELCGDITNELTDESEEQQDFEPTGKYNVEPKADEVEPSKKKKSFFWTDLLFSLLLCLFLVGASIGINILTCKMFGWRCDMGSITFSMVFSIIWVLCYHSINNKEGDE